MPQTAIPLLLTTSLLRTANWTRVILVRLSARTKSASLSLACAITQTIVGTALMNKTAVGGKNKILGRIRIGGYGYG